MLAAHVLFLLQIMNIYIFQSFSWFSLVAQMVKNLSAMQEAQVQSLSREDLLEKKMATHSSIVDWEIPMVRGTWQAIVPWGLKESDMTEWLPPPQSFSCRKLEMKVLSIWEKIIKNISWRG